MKLAVCLFAAALAIAACSRAPEAPAPDVAAQRTAAAAAALEEQRVLFASAPAASTDPASAYQFTFEGLMTPQVPLSAFTGDVVLVVNTASECGFTPQYEGLQQIYSDYRDQGFAVVGVPANNFMNQEPGSSQQISEFCTLNYGVTFPMTAKADVIGAQRHPFYAWAESQLGEAAVPGWNFHKLLIGRDGRLIAAFGTRADPAGPEVRAAIQAALAAPAPATAQPTALNRP